MAIPQEQLETWSHQGAKTQSASTYATVKGALENVNAIYTNRTFEVFLQGSYGNDTNIYFESDVDVVIRYDGAYFHDVSSLQPEQQRAFNAAHSDGTYLYTSFKGHVQAALEAAFGRSVTLGEKAIKIAADGSRRSADVVVAFEYHRYHKFNSNDDQSVDTGIALYILAGDLIPNYPKQHADNCTAKHQVTGSKFKPAVSIFKNVRSKLVGDGILGDGIAPSYYIEGLLYNVPNTCFSGTYANVVLNILKWLHQTADRTQFVCANEQYYLLRNNSAVCWPTGNGNTFIEAAVKLWDNW